MKYTKVYLESIGYEIAPVVVTSMELERRLAPVYSALHLAEGQLEALTGIAERRWWEPGHRLSDGAIAAARRALNASGVRPDQLDAVLYGAVCREYFEPATACRVASALGVGPETAVYDVGNACLGALNGMVEIANRIESGQARAGLVVACEASREINEIVIRQLLENPSMDFFKTSLATFTGGSGAAAILLTDGSFDGPRGRKLVGGVWRTAPQFHDLCRWGIEVDGSTGSYRQFTATDAAAVQTNGVELGTQTWHAFLRELGWSADSINRAICHQVGASHRDTILKRLGLDEDRDFPTFPYLGNMGTVSLPMTAGLADDRGFLRDGDRVAFLGIGSGLNCMMLGLEW